jgi:hypothetical protein
MNWQYRSVDLCLEAVTSAANDSCLNTCHCSLLAVADLLLLVLFCIYSYTGSFLKRAGLAASLGSTALVSVGGYSFYQGVKALQASDSIEKWVWLEEMIEERC